MAITSTPFSTTALRTELTTDPASLGYASFVAAHDLNTLSDMLNVSRPGGGSLVYRAPVTAGDLFDKITAEDFRALNTTDLARLQTILTLDRIDLSVPETFKKVTEIFQPGAPTLLDMTKLQTRDGSRAEVLWGPGTIISPNEVSEALE